MITRTRLARIKARAPKAKKTVKKTDIHKGIVMKNLDGEVVEEFNAIEDAILKGYKLPNLRGALKNGNKYKGYLWAYVEKK